METFEKTVLDRLNKLVVKGWQPLINLLDNGWHCNMSHKTFDRNAALTILGGDFSGKVSFNKQMFDPKEDLSPLHFHVRCCKTMLDAIIAACDIAELIKVEDAPTG
jgi:hypothetical protein